MSRLAVFLGGLICMLAIGGFILAEIAEAKRFGGGSSFGSRPSYQRPAQQPSQPQQRQSQQQNQQPNQQQGQQQAQQSNQQTPARSGIGGMFGGMLGGMLLGGLIGSLLFGGMGAFSGINFIDIVVIGLVLFLLYRFFRSRRLAPQAAGPASVLDADAPQERPEVVLNRTSPRSSASDSTGTASGKSAWDSLNEEPSGSPSPGVTVPDSFDMEEFLSGAKAAYSRLQKSWNNRDLEDIRNFTTREVFAEIKRQQKSAPMMGQTELLQVDASLLEVREEGNAMICSVLFDVLLREDASSAQSAQIQEIWHFSRPAGGQGVWLLEGIQQTG